MEQEVGRGRRGRKAEEMGADGLGTSISGRGPKPVYREGGVLVENVPCDAVAILL